MSKPIKIRMGGYGPPTTGFSKSLKFIGDRLEKQFGSDVAIEYVFNIMATAHDFLDSIEGTVDGNIRRESGWPVFWQAAAVLTTHTRVGPPCLLHCAKMRAEPT